MVFDGRQTMSVRKKNLMVKVVDVIVTGQIRCTVNTLRSMDLLLNLNPFYYLYPMVFGAQALPNFNSPSKRGPHLNKSTWQRPL